MKHRIIKQAIGLALSACLLLSGCSASTGKSVFPSPQNSDVVDAPVAMGRYIESELQFPRGDLSPLLSIQDDGTLDLYNAAEGKLLRYTSKDGVVWDQQDVGAIGDLPKADGGFGDLVNVCRKGDAVYVLYRDASYQPRLAKSVDGGPLETIAIAGWSTPRRIGSISDLTQGDAALKESAAQSATQEDGVQAGPTPLPTPSADPGSSPAPGEQDETMAVGPVLLYPQSLAVLDNGDLLIGYFDKIVRYDPQGKELQSFVGDGSDMTLGSGVLSFIGKGRNSIESVDLASNKALSSVPLPSTAAADTFMSYSGEGGTMDADAAGALFYANQKGIHRLAPGGQLWETVVDGDLTSLCIPSMHVGGLLLDQKGGFYVTLLDDKGAHLMHYTYSADTPSVPNDELTVFALANNETVRQAIGVFQREHPDVKVTYRYGLSEDGSATKDDVIRTLNAELLAGKGPDILLLDGMPTESYIEKGVLTDLTQALSPLLDSGELLQNIVDGFKRDGKLYSLPVRIAVPVMIGSRKDVDAAKTLQGLADAVAQANDPNYLADNTPKGRLAEFFLTSAPVWIKADRSIDQAKLAQFLSAIKTVSEVCRDDDSAQPTEEVRLNLASGPDELGFADGGFLGLIALNKGNLKLHVQMLNGFAALAIPVSVKNKIAGEIAPLSGQSASVFVPHGLVGVNSASKQQDLAASFIRCLFGESVQGTDLNDGFAVNAEALTSAIANQSNAGYMISVGGTDGGDVISASNPSQEDLQAFYGLLRSLNTPSTVDAVLLEMIQDESDAFFAGEKTAEQTAAAIAERTQAYLAE